jgi:DNA-binding PadR family transcriptional regulator
MFSKRRGLRAWILSLLDAGPKNGGEIMNAIEEMSQGWWRPSPGSIYPLLDELTKDGYITKQPDGRYALTEKTRAEIQWPPWMHSHQLRQPEDMLNELNGYISYFEDLSKSDRKKFDPYVNQLIALRDRLSTLVRGGGEKA